MQCNVLLIEDNPDDIVITQEAFEQMKLPHHLDVIKEALDVLLYLKKIGPFKNAIRPDIILLDLNLPKKSGHEILCEIKQDPDLKEIPVIILTTSSAERDIVQCYQNHANSFITKPVDFNDFLHTVSLLNEYWFNLVKLPDVKSP